MEALSKKMTALFIRRGILSSDDRELYDYCFELLLSNAVNLVIVAGAFLLSGRYLETLFFLLGFLPLRLTCGGYHAKTHYGCTGLLVFFLGCFYCGLRLLPQALLPAASLCCAGLTVPVVWTLAPIEHENKPVEAKKRTAFRRGAIAAAAVEFVLVLGLALARFPEHLAFSVSFGMLSMMISLLMAAVHKKKIQKEV